MERSNNEDRRLRDSEAGGRRQKADFGRRQEAALFSPLPTS